MYYGFLKSGANGRHSHAALRILLRLAFWGVTIMAFGQADAPIRFSAVMPLGADSILLQPANERLNMLLSVECPEMENIIVSGQGTARTAHDPRGKPVKYYPRDVAFRFTIGSRTASEELHPNEFETKAGADKFQSNLHFRLKVFHGTFAKTYEPVDLKMLGVPTDIPYDERIYHFTFKLKDVPVEDRMMLEILDEHGTRVGKFHLQIL